MRHSLDDYLTNGVFTAGQFTAPTPGTKGNEQTGQFRQPDFAQTDLSFYKNTRLTKDVEVQFRFEFYNVFNRKNLYLRERSLVAGLRQGHQPAAAAVVADWRATDVLTDRGTRAVIVRGRPGYHDESIQTIISPSPRLPQIA